MSTQDATERPKAKSKARKAKSTKKKRPVRRDWAPANANANANGVDHDQAARDHLDCEPNNLPPVTDCQLRVLLVFDEMAKQDSIRRAPTIKLLARALVKGKTTVQQHLECLKKNGCLEGDYWVRRGAKVTVMGRRVIDTHLRSVARQSVK